MTNTITTKEGILCPIPTEDMLRNVPEIIAKAKILIGKTAEHFKVFAELEVSRKREYCTTGEPVIWETTDHGFTHEQIRVSLTCHAYDFRRKDWAWGGQAQEELLKLPTYAISKQTVRELVKLWEVTHLNDMHPGCRHQQEGSYEDKAISGQVCPVSGYKYGSKWLYEAVPQGKLQRLYEIFGVAVA